MLTAPSPTQAPSLFEVVMKQVEGTVAMTGVPPGLVEPLGMAMAYGIGHRPDTALARARELAERRITNNE